jgi:hypothetical protein
LLLISTKTEAGKQCLPSTTAVVDQKLKLDHKTLQLLVVLRQAGWSPVCLEAKV